MQMLEESKGAITDLKGIQSSYLIRYIGDHEIYKPFSHRNCKKSCKPFVR